MVSKLIISVVMLIMRALGSNLNIDVVHFSVTFFDGRKALNWRLVQGVPRFSPSVSFALYS